MKRIALALAAALMAAIGIVSCDQSTACASTTGISPRPAPAPAPRAPSFSKPSAPRLAPAAPRPSTGGHSTTVIPAPIIVGDRC
ncbi:hypothetical protein AB0D13_08970 [Streptomyces sp. NPDC048430]|uniref:hypothetical protein n=1 Tax=Streptomyces sp. NPDC048430 TaxID=3155388 RepID=UPI00344A95BE